MAPGTIIRILIGIILLIVPGILAFIFGAKCLIYYIFLALIPFLFVWEEGCNCTNCLFTGYCEYTKKVKFVKNIFKFTLILYNRNRQLYLELILNKLPFKAPKWANLI